MKRNKSQLIMVLSLCLVGILFLSGCEISSSSDVVEIPSTSGDGNAAPVVEEQVEEEAAPEASVEGEAAAEEGTATEGEGEAAAEEGAATEDEGEAAAEEGSTTEGESEAAAEEGAATEGEGEAAAEEVVTEAPPADGIYVVQSGDTLGQIAERFGVSVADIAAASGLANIDSLDIGQELTIPEAGFAETAANSEGGEQVHVVRAGDTLFSIGRAYGFTVQELQQYNGIANANSLDVGQEIKIPAGE